MPQAMLDCGQCGARKFTTIVEEQLNLLQASGAARIFCEQCGQMTAWGYANHDRRSVDDRRAERMRVPVAPVAMSQPDLRAAAPSAAGAANPYAELARSFMPEPRADSGRRAAQQRRHRRVPLTMPLRVTARGNGAVIRETTQTVNVCRNGVYFQSEQAYQPDLTVSIELNYQDTAMGPGMQQPGVVVRIDPLPKSHRRGIAVKLN